MRQNSRTLARTAASQAILCQRLRELAEMDTLRPMAETSNSRQVVILMTEMYPKFSGVVPNLYSTASLAAMTLMANWIMPYDISSLFLANSGTTFVSQFFNARFRLLKFQKANRNCLSLTGVKPREATKQLSQDIVITWINPNLIGIYFFSVLRTRIADEYKSLQEWLSWPIKDAWPTGTSLTGAQSSTAKRFVSSISGDHTI